MVLAGNHVLVTTVLYRDGHCRYAVDARDPATDRVDWHLDGYDLHTTDGGLGCEQRKDPLGSGRYVVALGPDNREQLLDTGSGKAVYKAADGESTSRTSTGGWRWYAARTRSPSRRST